MENNILIVIPGINRNQLESKINELLGSYDESCFFIENSFFDKKDDNFVMNIKFTNKEDCYSFMEKLDQITIHFFYIMN